jgi:hypothetical protein
MAINESITLPKWKLDLLLDTFVCAENVLKDFPDVDPKSRHLYWRMIALENCVRRLNENWGE